MYARVTRSRSTPETIDQGVAWFEQTALPRAQSQPGFAGALDLFDRETGAGLTVTLWETAAAREASETMATGMRGDAESALDAEIVGVERYEVTTRVLS